MTPAYLQVRVGEVSSRTPKEHVVMEKPWQLEQANDADNLELLCSPWDRKERRAAVRGKTRR